MKFSYFLLQFFRRKHKEEASKESSRHSRDVVGEGRKTGRHSPETKQDESVALSDGFAKMGKGSKPSETTASLKINVPGTSNEGASSFAPSSSEENGARTSLQTSPANVDGEATLVGRSLPCMFFLFTFPD